VCADTSGLLGRRGGENVLRGRGLNHPLGPLGTAGSGEEFCRARGETNVAATLGSLAAARVALLSSSDIRERWPGRAFSPQRNSATTATQNTEPNSPTISQCLTGAGRGSAEPQAETK
jgi:hypothetical protein